MWPIPIRTSAAPTRAASSAWSRCTIAIVSSTIAGSSARIRDRERVQSFVMKLGASFHASGPWIVRTFVRTFACMELAVESPLAAYRAAYDAHDVDALLASHAPRRPPRLPDHRPLRVRRTRDNSGTCSRTSWRPSTSGAHVLDVGDDHTRAMKLVGRIGKQRFAETLLFTLDDDGLIAEIEIFVRPMPGLLTMAAALGPRVARRRGRMRALAVRLMMGPLAATAARRRAGRLEARRAVS